MSTGNKRAARQATLDLLDKNLRTVSKIRTFIYQSVRGVELTKEQRINLQNCFDDARSEHTWQAMNYMIRFIKESQKK